ncbi:MAG: hypothetical protein M0P73_06055 [Syntrophobacterales bacterium]|jgi:hypothetical protein|nr:hypothetical protein [Syntrophobacterales bacterium]
MNNYRNAGSVNYLLETDDATSPKYDLLVRVYGPTLEDAEVNITGTIEFKKHFDNIFKYFKFVKDTLVEVILSQKRTLDYNGFYNAFLLEQVSEEEFDKIAEQFTYTPKVIDHKLLASKINALLELTKIDYSTSELSDIFQCDNDNVTEAIQTIRNSNVFEELQ